MDYTPPDSGKGLVDGSGWVNPPLRGDVASAMILLSNELQSDNHASQ